MLVQKHPRTVEGYGRTFKYLVELSYSHTLLNGGGYWDDKMAVDIGMIKSEFVRKLRLFVRNFNLSET